MTVFSGALQQGLVRCRDCGTLTRKAAGLKACPLCGSRLHPRIPNSLQRTLACLLCGYALYIPANIYPIMTVTRFGTGEPHTIFGGILVLIKGNMLPIAVLVFIASILVPILKLIGLSLLCLCAHYRWQVNARRWTLTYRIIAFVGRWSMLDIFMISILIALVDREGVARVLAGPAATSFASVVVITLFAAKNFDPRLIWDNQANP